MKGLEALVETLTFFHVRWRPLEYFKLEVT